MANTAKERAALDERARLVKGGLIATDKIKVPMALATGKYEELTEDELNDHYYDVCHELTRRGLMPDDR